MKLQEYLTFNDVLLKPCYSTIRSRSEVDLSVSICKGFKFNTPLIPANMMHVFGYDMAVDTFNRKGLGFVHRFMNLKEKKELFSLLRDNCGEDVFNYVGMSIGVKPEDYIEITKFIDWGIKIICLDIAHGASVLADEMIKFIAKKYPDVLLVAGNTATAEDAVHMWNLGVDINKSGIGAGSSCETRREAGVGCPQLTTIMEVAEAKEFYKERTGKDVYFISDGGHSIPADFSKALCFADFVMAGNVFAGTDESPGEIVEIDGKRYKDYHGSSTHKTDRVEGVKALVPYRGPVNGVYKRIHEGLQSAASYTNSRNLTELKDNPQFVRITQAGWAESGPHHLIVK